MRRLGCSPTSSHGRILNILGSSRTDEGQFTMNLKSIKKQVRSVHGWLSTTEGKALYKAARKCTGRGVIVEIGSWQGKSTIWLAHGSRAGRNVKVHAVDPHTGSTEHHEAYGEVWTYEQFCRNINKAGVEDVIEPHVAFSEEFAKGFNEPVELVFVDGLHEWEGVKGDFDAWFPKVVEGGVMMFHDTTCWDDCRKLVVDYVFKSRVFKKVGFSGSITYGTKVAENSWFDRVRNRVMLGWFLTHAYLDRLSWRVGHNHVLPIYNRIAGLFRPAPPEAKPTPAPVAVNTRQP
jgi:MMP 1-O-methyltransferase